MNAQSDFLLFTGSANPPLGAVVAGLMKARLGNYTADDQGHVHLHQNVRNKDVFILQPAPPPVNDHLVELLAIATAATRGRACRVVAVIPYFGYTRSEQGSAVTRILRSCGIDQVISLDPHLMEETLATAIRGKVPAESIVVSAHEKAVRLAECFGEILDLPVVELHRHHASADVADRPILLVDDLIATGRTMVHSIETLIGAGARFDFTIAATHGVLLRESREKLNLPIIRQIVVTDSVIPQEIWPRIHTVSVAPLIVSAINHAAKLRPCAAA